MRGESKFFGFCFCFAVMMHGDGGTFRLIILFI